MVWLVPSSSPGARIALRRHGRSVKKRILLSGEIYAFAMNIWLVSLLFIKGLCLQQIRSGKREKMPPRWKRKLHQEGVGAPIPMRIRKGNSTISSAALRRAARKKFFPTIPKPAWEGRNASGGGKKNTKIMPLSNFGRCKRAHRWPIWMVNEGSKERDPSSKKDKHRPAELFANRFPFLHPQKKLYLFQGGGEEARGDRSGSLSQEAAAESLRSPHKGEKGEKKDPELDAKGKKGMVRGQSISA